MLNVRGTIIAAKRKCLYLAAALAIDDEQQKWLDEAGKQEKAIPPQTMTQKKVWVREWLTRKPEVGQCHDEFTNSWRIVHNPFTKFCCDQNFEYFKILVPTLIQSRQVYTHFTPVYEKFAHWHDWSRGNACHRIVCQSSLTLFTSMRGLLFSLSMRG